MAGKSTKTAAKKKVAKTRAARKPAKAKRKGKRAVGKRAGAKATGPRKAAAKSRMYKSGKSGAYRPPPHYAVSKSDGDEPIQAWIDLLPGWQTARARRIDVVVTRQMPDVHKAVKWHGAWYGVPGRGWFLAVASFKAHLKLVFLDGTSLRPVPPVPLATKPQRALDVREADELDEARLAGWVEQASRLPGWGKA